MLLAGLQQELARWETMLAGDYLAGDLSAVDFTLYPYLALVLRIGQRVPSLAAAGLAGPRLTTWQQRMEALPVTQASWPPHWR